jgi:hypothetical protein
VSAARRRAGRVALALAGLVGCSEGPVVIDTYVAIAYTPNEFGRGAARRDLLTEVRGDPLALGAGAFAGGVVELLNRHEPRPQPTTFALAPDDSADPAYRVILLFDAPRAVNSLSVCRQPPAAEPAPPDTLRVTGAFCRGGTTLTKVTAETGSVTGLDDPKLDALLAQVVRDLFPIRGGDRD